MSKGLRVLYNCDNCPAYCCSYESIGVSASDIRRLARHFDITISAAKKRFIKKDGETGEPILRHHRDEVFGSVCRFLDRETRRCTVYKARPRVCRQHPGSGRCGYYDFLCAERHLQEDPEIAATTWNH